MTYYQPQNNGMFMPQQNYLPVLNGKIVESEEIVRATEIPFNGFGVFPQADLKNVYLKTWNADGTTKIITYIPIIEEAPKDDLLSEIKKLSKKIDELKPSITPTSTPMKKRKGVDEDDA